MAVEDPDEIDLDDLDEEEGGSGGGGDAAPGAGASGGLVDGKPVAAVADESEIDIDDL